MAAVRLAAVSVLCTFVLTPVSDASPHRSPSLATLLARHAPIVVLHPEEQFLPVPVDGFLADSDLTRKTATGWEKVDEPLPAGGADLRLDQRFCQAVAGVAAAQCYADSESAHAAMPVVYARASRTSTRIVLQYWLWYAFDDYSPTVPAGDIWQVHEGDWEAVAVVLDLAGNPLLAGYSEHGKGTRREWVRVPKRGNHPLVYVALGSHANYFRAGEPFLDPRIVDPTLITVIGAYGVKPVEHTGGGRTLAPRLVTVTATSPSWMTFAGAWGETGYLHVPNNAPIAAGAGPRGPAFQALWRAPVKTVLGWPRA